MLGMEEKFLFNEALQLMQNTLVDDLIRTMREGAGSDRGQIAG